VVLVGHAEVGVLNDDEETSILRAGVRGDERWIFTHPVNKFWLKDRKLEGFSGGFFGFDPIKRSAADR
jgi:hypothetical protein